MKLEPRLIVRAPLFISDRQLADELISLCDCLKLVRELMNDEEAYCFEQNLHHLSSPLDLATDHVKLIVSQQR